MNRTRTRNPAALPLRIAACALAAGPAAYAQPPATEPPGYLAARAADFADLAAFRLRLGPGLSFRAQATRRLDLFAGSHNLWNVGLPGYSLEDGWGGWTGRETEHGIVLFGIDATDDTPDEIEYGPSEFSLGAHLFLVGAEAGIDPAEWIDFFGGVVGFDPLGDDIARTSPESRRGPRPDGKPTRFDGLGHRLDYARVRINRRLDAEVVRMDDWFAGTEGASTDAVPAARFRFGLYAEVSDPNKSPDTAEVDFDLDLFLPSLEDRWELFLTRREVGELPGTDPVDREDANTRIGLVRAFSSVPVSFDAGLRLELPPEAFAGVQWRRRIDRGAWRIVPRTRLFYETKDGFGALASLRARRWAGRRQQLLWTGSSAARITEQSDGTILEQNLGGSYVGRLLNPDRRGSGIGHDDITRGIGLLVNLRARADSDGARMERYRLTMPYRHPLYRNWIILLVQPRLEWNKQFDWDPEATLRIGADLVFWQ